MQPERRNVENGDGLAVMSLVAGSEAENGYRIAGQRMKQPVLAPNRRE
jgi:hypothetical protein